MMRKCLQTKEDPYLGQLNFRNTPTEGLYTSLAQRLMGRRTKTLIPTTTIALKPNQPRNTKTKMEVKRTKVAVRSTNRKSLHQLHPRDTVRVQPTQPGHRVWKMDTVTQHLGRRIYEVATEDGATLKRNRRLFRAKHTSADNPNVAKTTGETTPKDNSLHRQSLHHRM